MKKYNLSKIMKRAWKIVKTIKTTMSDALKKAWLEAKSISDKIKFENHMDITVDGYTRELSRWTKGSHDRIYINGGSGKGDGWVDIKSGVINLYNRHSSYGKKMAQMIFDMEF